MKPAISLRLRRSATLAVLMLPLLTATAAAEIQGISVALPPGEQWVLASEVSEGADYTREWIPAGTTPEDTYWLIVEMRQELAEKTTAKKFLQGLFTYYDAHCSATLFQMEKLKLGDEPAFWGEAVCAHKIGTGYGLVIDQRVLVDGKTIYVVTSELRTPPQVVAGRFLFENEDDLEAFALRLEASTHCVREGVALCPSTGR